MKQIDRAFIFFLFALLAIGAMMIFSATPTLGLRVGDPFFYITRHFFYLVLGAVAFGLALRLDLEEIRKNSGTIFIVAIILMLLLFVPGIRLKVSGAARWVSLPFFTFQPSEIMKLAMIFFLANYLSKRKEAIKDFRKGLLLPLIMLAVVDGLTMLQPDMGTALVLSGITFVMLFVGGARIKHLGAILLSGVGAGAALIAVEPYRFARILAYLNPWDHPRDIGFHIIQSLIAVGSGGFWGVGLGGSRQKFFYLPQQYTDFIFAIICEELGFIGAVAIIALVIFFIGRGLMIAEKTKDQFSALVVVGIMSWIGIQAMINMLVVIGILPTTGIPLPFISYGGTSTIILMFAAGIVARISRG